MTIGLTLSSDCVVTGLSVCFLIAAYCTGSTGIGGAGGLVE